MDNIYDGSENHHVKFLPPATTQTKTLLLQVTSFCRGVWHITAEFFPLFLGTPSLFHFVRCTAACGALRGTPDATISTSLASCGLDVASAEREGSGSRGILVSTTKRRKRGRKFPAWMVESWLVSLWSVNREVL